jgi:hypothetical protein
MPSFLYRMPSGIPGSISRPLSPFNVEPGVILATNPPTAYGVPLAVDATTGHFRPIGAGDTASLIYGLNVRAFPTQSGNSPPPVSGGLDVMTLGYMSVKCNYGTPAKNGIVYVRIAANGANTIIGGIEATSDTTFSIIMTGAHFTGAADAYGNAEIAYNLGA